MIKIEMALVKCQIEEAYMEMLEIQGTHREISEKPKSLAKDKGYMS